MSDRKSPGGKRNRKSSFKGAKQRLRVQDSDQNKVTPPDLDDSQNRASIPEKAMSENSDKQNEVSKEACNLQEVTEPYNITDDDSRGAVAIDTPDPHCIPIETRDFSNESEPLVTDEMNPPEMETIPDETRKAVSLEQVQQALTVRNLEEAESVTVNQNLLNITNIDPEVQSDDINEDGNSYKAQSWVQKPDEKDIDDVIQEMRVQYKNRRNVELDQYAAIGYTSAASNIHGESEHVVPEETKIQAEVLIRDDTNPRDLAVSNPDAQLQIEEELRNIQDTGPEEPLVRDSTLDSQNTEAHFSGSGASRNTSDASKHQLDKDIEEEQRNTQDTEPQIPEEPLVGDFTPDSLNTEAHFSGSGASQNTSDASKHQLDKEIEEEQRNTQETGPQIPEEPIVRDFTPDSHNTESHFSGSGASQNMSDASKLQLDKDIEEEQRKTQDTGPQIPEEPIVRDFTLDSQNTGAHFSGSGASQNTSDASKLKLDKDIEEEQRNTEDTGPQIPEEPLVRDFTLDSRNTEAHFGVSGASQNMSESKLQLDKDIIDLDAPVHEDTNPQGEASTADSDLEDLRLQVLSQKFQSFLQSIRSSIPRTRSLPDFTGSGAECSARNESPALSDSQEIQFCHEIIEKIECILMQSLYELTVAAPNLRRGTQPEPTEDPNVSESSLDEISEAGFLAPCNALDSDPNPAPIIYWDRNWKEDLNKKFKCLHDSYFLLMLYFFMVIFYDWECNFYISLFLVFIFLILKVIIFYF